MNAVMGVIVLGDFSVRWLAGEGGEGGGEAGHDQPPSQAHTSVTRAEHETKPEAASSKPLGGSLFLR